MLASSLDAALHNRSGSLPFPRAWVARGLSYGLVPTSPPGKKFTFAPFSREKPPKSHQPTRVLRQHAALPLLVDNPAHHPQSASKILLTHSLTRHLRACTVPFVTFVIERGIPIPPMPRGAAPGAKHTRWPWAQMRVGDSFLTTKKPHSAVFAAEKGSKGTFTVRKVDGGWRVWRLK
jgi:hypothetical protein